MDCTSCVTWDNVVNGLIILVVTYGAYKIGYAMGKDC